MEKTLTKADLAQFTGSEVWYRHGLVREITFTDGAKYVVDIGGAYWLIDEIALAQRYEKSVSGEEFQLWKLTVSDLAARRILKRREEPLRETINTYHQRNTKMTIEQIIPLNHLVYSKANVRRTGKNEGIGELAASIAAHGLRQNLNVKPSDDGEHFEVVAGGRRLRAMKQLVKDKKLKKDVPVNCLVLEEGEDPEEISLVENAMRTAMHPDDQFEAFRGLIEDKGLSIEEVAARFGVTPSVVKQRLKLANVSQNCVRCSAKEK